MNPIEEQFDQWIIHIGTYLQEKGFIKQKRKQPIEGVLYPFVLLTKELALEFKYNQLNRGCYVRLVRMINGKIPNAFIYRGIKVKRLVEDIVLQHLDIQDNSIAEIKNLYLTVGIDLHDEKFFESLFLLYDSVINRYLDSLLLQSLDSLFPSHIPYYHMGSKEGRKVIDSKVIELFSTLTENRAYKFVQKFNRNDWVTEITLQSRQFDIELIIEYRDCYFAINVIKYDNLIGETAFVSSSERKMKFFNKLQDIIVNDYPDLVTAMKYIINLGISTEDEDRDLQFGIHILELYEKLLNDFIARTIAPDI